jgi:glycosyltransferase involved in cell wall biosynthesis
VSRRVVVLGMMAKLPIPGVVWQTLHYLEGFRRLGFDVHYVEAHARTPSMLMQRSSDDGSGRAAVFLDRLLRRFGLAGRWAFQALHDDGRVYGMSAGELRTLLGEAELIVNLHGGTEPREELAATGRLVYLETDPVQLQIELHDGRQSTVDFLDAHCAFFTFAENLGRPECSLPVDGRFAFRPTRQPVVLDWWAGRGEPGPRFTTIANWRQGWRAVRYRGETYGWSKDAEWAKFLDLPARTGETFELALSGYEPRDAELLQRHGWRLRDALDFADDIYAYRGFVAGSRAEFTVAKDQNVRFRTGWFSDRSATYLAAGRAVVTQDTGFGAALPTGDGLHAVADASAAADAVARIAADPVAQGRAAYEVAQEHFEAGRVVGRLLTDMGVSLSRRTKNMPVRARRSLRRESTVLALIPHFHCEQYLDDCLASLVAQTRPLDGIVVIDDASERPPVDIVRRYPEVTLLHAAENVGPYRLIQQVIEDTAYDAYLFQDADDWSAPDRLEHLLAGAEEAQAEMVGSQEVRVFCDEPESVPIAWPLDGNAAFLERATAFPLLHPTTLVSRALVMDIGGFSSGLRFGGDAEFLRRAHYVARCVNVPHHGYYRRIRQNSLTTAPSTAIGTPVRKQLMEETFARANANREAVQAGREPDLSPLRTAPPVGLRRLTGPLLCTRDEEPVARRPGNRAPTVEVDGPPRPVFVIGADRSGASALACALGQHPGIELSVTGAVPAARRWVDGSWQHTDDVGHLAALFPDATFIHIVRDAHSAVRAMSDPPLGSPGATGGTQVPARLRDKLPEGKAVERWLRAVEGAAQAEEELGADRVLTVTYAELIDDPEALVRRCLQFVGEEFRAECMRPLRELRTLVVAEPLQPDVEPATWERAVALSDRMAPPPARAKPPRVVMVTDHFPKVSETFFVRKLLGLVRRGWDVHVVCQRSNKEHWQYFPTLLEQLGDGRRIHVAADGIEEKISELEPDVVHFGYGTLACGRMHLREALGCRMVVSFRGYDLNTFRVDDESAYADVWRGADVLHLVSESLRDRALERGCPPDAPHVVIPDAVDVGFFAPPAARDAEVGTAERPLRVLTVGRLHWKKGHEHGLAAVRRALDAGVEVAYRIVGEGEHREATQFLVRDLGLGGRADLLGSRTVEEVRELMAWADVLLHPSLTEAFGVAVVEAQAMGLPVVCSDAGGLPENVLDGETGFLAPRRDAAAMGDALARLARDGELRLRMGAAARHRAETELSAEHQLDRFEELYRRVLEAPPAADPRPLHDARRDARRRELQDLREQVRHAHARREQLREQLWRREVVEGVHAYVERALPAGARVLVVSRGDEDVVGFTSHRGAHFPQTADGAYAGHHPADSAAAIVHLSELRARGAEYLVVPATSQWWLEYYDGFAAHVEPGRMSETSEACVAFALAPVGAKVAA